MVPRTRCRYGWFHEQLLGLLLHTTRANSGRETWFLTISLGTVGDSQKKPIATTMTIIANHDMVLFAHSLLQIGSAHRKACTLAGKPINASLVIRAPPGKHRSSSSSSSSNEKLLGRKASWKKWMDDSSGFDFPGTARRLQPIRNVRRRDIIRM